MWVASKAVDHLFVSQLKVQVALHTRSAEQGDRQRVNQRRLRVLRTFPIQYGHRARLLEISLTAYPLTSLITLLICILMLVTGINVGRARGRYG